MQLFQKSVTVSILLILSGTVRPGMYVPPDSNFGFQVFDFGMEVSRDECGRNRDVSTGKCIFQ